MSKLDTAWTCSCGENKFFLQAKGDKVGKYCAACGRYIKWVGKKDLAAFHTKGFRVHPEGYKVQLLGTTAQSGVPPYMLPDEPLGGTGTLGADYVDKAHEPMLSAVMLPPLGGPGGIVPVLPSIPVEELVPVLEGKLQPEGGQEYVYVEAENGYLFVRSPDRQTVYAIYKLPLAPASQIKQG